MLEATILPKKKKEIEEKIVQIRSQIENLDGKLIDVSSFGNNKNNNQIISEKNENIELN